MTQWAKYSSFRWLALVIREMIAASLWAFAFVKLWIYDVDIILIENYALYLTPLLHYRLFFIIAFIALSWLILGNKHFRVFIAYVLFYPFIIILWRLPKLAVKNLVTALVTAIVFAPAIEALIRAFKIRFIMVSLAILSGAAVVILSQPYLLMFFMTILLIYLFIHYIYRFRIAFHPSSIFSDLAAPMRDSWSDTLIRFKNRYLEEISRFDPESQEYRNQYMHSLGSVFLISIFFKFCEKKLREVVDSRKTDLYFLLALLYTFVLTVLVFAFEYHALYKIDPSSFALTRTVSFWAFLAFSFDTIMTANLSLITPASPPALILSYIELFSGVMILIIFVFLILTSNRERYRENLTMFIDQIETSSSQTMQFIEAEFRVSIIEAEEQLRRATPSFIKAIERFGGNSIKKLLYDSRNIDDQ